MAGLDPRELGERGLIEALRRRSRGKQGAWVVGIGDDAAVLRPRVGRDLVVTADALVEGVHFRWTTTEAGLLGRKTLAVNLSDLAAMGAKPLGFLLTWALPGDAAGPEVEAFLRGLLSEARAAQCPLVGGDTVASPHWVLNVNAFGDLPRGKALRRDGARAGDRLMVTGTLGAAGLGLWLLESGVGEQAQSRAFVRRHRCPRPPYAAGPRLLHTSHATAAIDLSDGLARDLDHILQASGLGADVHLERLPLARGMRAACDTHGLDPDSLALHGGEDYELLFCVRPNAPSAAVFTRRLGCRVSEIGTLRAGRGARYLRAGKPVPVQNCGFEHFKTASLPTDK